MTPPPTSPQRTTSGHQPLLPTTPLVLVTGKGGVGRSTTATAIAVTLAERGARVALVHPVDAPPVRPPHGSSPTLQVVPLDRDDALANYIGDQVPGPLAAALRMSRAFRLIAAATPGLAELLTIGELRRMAKGPYDHIVFDAPATGHLLALLDAPGRFERAAVAGPVAARASELGAWITDEDVTAFVTVTTGDSLAVSELMDLVQTLEERLGHGPAMVVANRLAPGSPGPAELERLVELTDSKSKSATPAATAALLQLAARSRSERSQLGRLTRAFGTSPVRAHENPGTGVQAVVDALHGLEGDA